MLIGVLNLTYLPSVYSLEMWRIWHIKQWWLWYKTSEKQLESVNWWWGHSYIVHVVCVFFCKAINSDCANHIRYHHSWKLTLQEWPLSHYSAQPAITVKLCEWEVLGQRETGSVHNTGLEKILQLRTMNQSVQWSAAAEDTSQVRYEIDHWNQLISDTW